MIRAYLSKDGLWMVLNISTGLGSLQWELTLNEAATLAEQIELALPAIDPDRGKPVMDA
jgi:hypothetical protein